MSIEQGYKYVVIYRPSTGKIFKAESFDVNTDYSELEEEFDILYFTEHTAVDIFTQSVDLNTLAIVDVPIQTAMPVRYATWDIVKDIRNQFENNPLATIHGPLDVDTESLARLDYAIANFLTLPTVEGGKLKWKFADNTIVALTYTELSLMRDNAKKDKADRTALLFAKAEEIKLADPALTVEFISDIANWLD